MSKFRYSDILNMEYPNPEIEKDFPDKILRAAQFAPFAALTGYGAAVNEAARLTESKIELDEYELEILNKKFDYIKNHIGDEQIYSITYFMPDKKKDGGQYVTIAGNIVKIKEFENIVVMADKTEIPIQDILLIESDAFVEPD